MKLELKHLAPYLPYDLVIQRVYEGNISDTQYSDTELLSIEDVKYYFGDNCSEFNSVKPILRPLSDLIKDVPDCEQAEYIADKGLSSELCYEEWENLFQNHFDVFGLIPQGLAININDLNK